MEAEAMVDRVLSILKQVLVTFGLLNRATLPLEYGCQFRNNTAIISIANRSGTNDDERRSTAEVLDTGPHGLLLLHDHGAPVWHKSAAGVNTPTVAPFLVAMALSACTPGEPVVESADLIFLNGPIYTLQPALPWAEALAVRGGRIVAVGKSSQIESFRGSSTRIVDLNGRMVMPGIIDAHMHPMRGGIKNLYQCNFPFNATPKEVQAAVGLCVASQPESEWILGGQWDSGFFERFDLPSPRALLDVVSADTAVVLKDDALHNVWVNSRALQLAGFDRNTLDPPGGKILRDEYGEASGVLLETAARLMLEQVPKYSPQQQTAAAEEFARIANGYGITGVKAAATYERELAGLKRADEQGKLSVHVAVSIRGSDKVRSKALDYAEFERIRAQYTSTHIHPNSVKIFLDGVPTAARTAAMLAPYLPAKNTAEQNDGGPVFLSAHLLAQDLIQLDRRGFSVKMHTAGDRAVRVALDAIEATRKANGNSRLRHELAHAGYVAASDLPRFAQLNAAVDLSPAIWHPSPILDSILGAVGQQRGSRYWPVRDLLDSGAFVIAGSDWPSVAPNANPWGGIEALVTRSDPNGTTPGALWPEQAITLAEAITIYTLNGAAALGLQDRTGSLKVGKSADLIVLDRKLFQIPITEVGDTTVLQTFFEGQLVYHH